MRLTAVTPMLTVSDIDRTIQFYKDVLGFKCVNRVEGWAALRNGEVEVMVRLPLECETITQPAFTGSLYFKLDNVDELWEKTKDKTAVVYPIENFFYGMREFAIRDNNGYMLQFGQPINDPSQIPQNHED